MLDFTNMIDFFSEDPNKIILSLIIVVLIGLIGGILSCLLIEFINYLKK